jgi:hypothetical protein
VNDKTVNFENSVERSGIGIARDPMHNSYIGDSKYKFFMDCQKNAMELHGLDDSPKDGRGSPKSNCRKMPKIKAWSDPNNQNYLTLSQFLANKTNKTNKKLFYLLQPGMLSHKDNPIVPIRKFFPYTNQN